MLKLISLQSIWNANVLHIEVGKSFTLHAWQLDCSGIVVRKPGKLFGIADMGTHNLYNSTCRCFTLIWLFWRILSVTTASCFSVMKPTWFLQIRKTNSLKNQMKKANTIVGILWKDNHFSLFWANRDKRKFVYIDPKYTSERTLGSSVFEKWM